MANEMCEKLIAELTENYIEKLFYFCLKKTGNSTEAEDLSSDIVMNIVAALHKGTIPTSFSAWVWQIARNRYSVWANRKHNYLQSVTGSDIGDYETEDESASVEEKWIRSEELSLLRRELAFISSDYRNIVVAFYIEDKKVRDIAAALNLPVGTVESKLFRARKILKEGMGMAREFGIRSYKPEEITFAASGSQPSGLPWSAVQRKIPKNILLAVSDSPMTMEELSIELGIAVPYVEEEVDLLVRATLLKKVGNKYITDFFIASRECQLETYMAQRKFSKERSKMIDTIVTDSLDAIRALGIVKNNMSDADLKWWAAIYCIDLCITALPRYNIEWTVPRANGETWGFIGYERAELPEKCIMGHNGCGSEKAMSWAYKIGDYGLWDRAGEMKYMEALFLADVIKNNRTITSFSDSEQKLWENIKNRFAHADPDGCVIPDILVADVAVLKKIQEILKSHPRYAEAMQNIQTTFDDTVAVLQKYSNPVLKQQLAYYAAMEILKIRMMTVRDEVEAGKLVIPNDPKHSTIAMWMVLG